MPWLLIVEPIILENNGELFYQTLNNQKCIHNYEYKLSKSRKFHIHLNNGAVFCSSVWDLVWSRLCYSTFIIKCTPYLLHWCAILWCGWQMLTKVSAYERVLWRGEKIKIHIMTPLRLFISFCAGLPWPILAQVIIRTKMLQTLELQTFSSTWMKKSAPYGKF